MNSKKIYPRTGDKETVYLKPTITKPGIIVGEYTMYNDFVNDPTQFENNNVLYHYPINNDRLIIGKYCSIACGAKFMLHQVIMQCLLSPLIHFRFFLKDAHTGGR